MKDLKKRANIDVYEVEIVEGVKKYVIIYEDHRTLLNVLFYARMKGVLTQSPNLIYFDYHDDARVFLDQQKLDANMPRTFLQDEFEQFWNFVEFSLAFDDNDWVFTGMHYDLIKKAVCVGVEEYDSTKALNKHFAGTNHYLCLSRHLDYELGDHGCFQGRTSLNDGEDKMIRDIFKLNLPTEQNPEIDTPFVLDFDLDCFSGAIDDTRMAWPEKVFCKRYCGTGAAEFLRDLMCRASFITICRESRYCGGIGEANKILYYLDKYFFYAQLHALPVEQWLTYMDRL